MSALEKLLEKGNETTSLEHAVQILYLNEATHGKPLTNEAADELADLRARPQAAKKLLRKAKSVFDAAFEPRDLRMAEKYINAALAILDGSQ